TLSLQKIFSGLSLQLAIYLGEAKNLSEVGDREAGAMLYCLIKMSNKGGRTDSDAAKEADKELKMPGLIRVDDAIKKAVDGTEKFVDFSKKNLVSRDEFQTIVSYAEKLLETTAERILSGCIEVKPAKFSNDDDACKYCLFSALCNFDRSINETATPVNLKGNEIISAMNEFLNDKQDRQQVTLQKSSCKR
ncbi:MAG: PD-(D/E)XK nuclease family protein, partial [Selenomonadaceae bacterium]|nr:PD-(D/E)XK nuclease family protein [Selenomonadaceae bacterium]